MNPFGVPSPAFGAAPVAPAPAAGLAPIGVSFQCEMKDGNGAAINFFLHFGPEAATNLDAIGALAGQLMQANVPLKVWLPKQNTGYGGRGGNNFNRGGGGFR